MERTYHLWNPFTDLEEFLPYKDVGPMTIVRGEGPFVYNEAGKKFINASGSLWNVAVGHGREELADIAFDQMKKLCYSSCFRQTHPKACELADCLCALTGNYYDKAYLGSNGSEAVETALKMTRQYFRQSKEEDKRGKYKILSFKGCYHGVSYGAIGLSGDETNERLYAPLPGGLLKVEPPYSYHRAYGTLDQTECEFKCLEEIQRVIEREGPDTMAAFIAEPVMGERGIVTISDSFFDSLMELLNRYDMLMIADEVTTGFGRTGDLFATDRWKKRPDILCLGKGISSGYLPVSAVLATNKVYENFKGENNYFQHGSTSSGNPVCSAVALGNIDIILRENLVENSRETGAYLIKKIKSLMEERPVLGDVRGRGLMIGLELVEDRITRKPLGESEMFEIVADCASLGVIVYYNRNVIALFPPLIITKDIADHIYSTLRTALDTSKKEEILKKKRLLKELVSSKMRTANS
ncbi:aspartate aminotransferase family protein [Lacrimispora amygdalina]|uniref:Aspartate aminotransferase family protein n=1 Tax=Lacrimispora amygdalina TaxID=253257 RepID=A0A3E2N7F3_9FIRM|nr:aspartate aminotransferase family protein [Clostridium indicum]RFZ76918.1 aspartate aminotransferase family protein [Clostridium indicum]